MTFSLIVGFWGCGGSGGGEDEPEPIPGEKVVKVECVLKSGVSSLDDTGLKGIISHVQENFRRVLNITLWMELKNWN